VPGRVEVDLGLLGQWCVAHLGEGIDEVLFRHGYLSTVIGVRLESRQLAVVKVRRAAGRLQACWAVHRALFEKGFPCPEPLVGPQPFDGFAASAESMVLGGELLPVSGRSPDPFASGLAVLIGLAPHPSELGSLGPPLPWTGPDPHAPDLWPPPDDIDVDLNGVEGPAWIDEAGTAARSKLERSRLPKVIGHGDWYSGNLRWSGSRLHVAWDWDSVIAASEAALAGLAGAKYPTTEAGTEPTADETEEFLEAYAKARGRPFTAAELDEAWAAGLWNRSFDAKTQVAIDGSPRSLTEEEAHQRLRHIRRP
jgi:hypothetical protein